MMAPSTKRRQSKPDSEQEDSIQTKRAKTTKAQTPPVRPGPAGPSSPSRGRNSIAASTVAWIRSENTNLVPFNDMEWLDRNIYGIFSDVKSESDFKIASFVFWTHYFVYQLGEDQKRREELFKNYIKPLIPASATGYSTFEDIFRQVHNICLSDIARQVDALMRQWIFSPAGEAFNIDIRTASSHRKTKPVLHVESIAQYVSENSKRSYQGIEITEAQVLAVYKNLSVISPVIAIKSEDDDTPVGHWFGHDHGALLNEKLHRTAHVNDTSSVDQSSVDIPSWYATLSSIVTRTLHQFILMKLNYQTAGGKTDQYDFDAWEKRVDADDFSNFDTMNVAKVMNRVVAAQKTFRPFPLHDYDTLEEWVGHCNKIESVALVFPPQKFIDDEYYDRFRQREYHTLQSGNVDDYMDVDSLEDAVQYGHDQAANEAEELNLMLNEAGVDTDYLVPNDFLLATAYPSAELRDPEWQPWLRAMASSNIYGHVEILYRRLTALQGGLNVLGAALIKRAKSLESHKKRLIGEAVAVRQAFKTLNKTTKQMTNTKSEIKDLDEEIVKTKRIPGVQKAIDLSADGEAGGYSYPSARPYRQVRSESPSVHNFHPPVSYVDPNATIITPESKAEGAANDLDKQEAPIKVDGLLAGALLDALASEISDEEQEPGDDDDGEDADDDREHDPPEDREGTQNGE